MNIYLSISGAAIIYLLYVLFSKNNKILKLLTLTPIFLFYSFFIIANNNINQTSLYDFSILHKFISIIYFPIASILPLILRFILYPPNLYKNKILPYFINTCYTTFPILLMAMNSPTTRLLATSNIYFSFLLKIGIYFSLVAFLNVFYSFYLFGRRNKE